MHRDPNGADVQPLLHPEIVALTGQSVKTVCVWLQINFAADFADREGFVLEPGRAFIQNLLPLVLTEAEQRPRRYPHCQTDAHAALLRQRPRAKWLGAGGSRRQARRASPDEEREHALVRVWRGRQAGTVRPLCQQPARYASSLARTELGHTRRHLARPSSTIEVVSRDALRL